MASKKDHQKYYDSLRQQGFRVLINGGDHVAIYAPDAREGAAPIAVGALTPGDSRGLKNLKAEVSRRMGWSNRGKVAAPPPPKLDGHVVEIFRLLVRESIAKGGKPEDVMLAYKTAGEVLPESVMVDIVYEEDERARLYREGQS